MRRGLLLIFLMMALAACGDSGGDSGSSSGSGSNNNNNPPAATTPEVGGPTLTAIVAQATANAAGNSATATPSTAELTATAIIAQATAMAGNPATNCETGLITETDAAAAARLDVALSAAGLDADSSNVLVTEDVLDCQTSNVVNTFISVPITVANTSDTTLGTVAAQALAAFVATDLPQPATLSMQFIAGSSQRSLSVNFADAQTYVNDGLTGAALVEALGG